MRAYRELIQLHFRLMPDTTSGMLLEARNIASGTMLDVFTSAREAAEWLRLRGYEYVAGTQAIWGKA